MKTLLMIAVAAMLCHMVLSDMHGGGGGGDRRPPPKGTMRETGEHGGKKGQSDEDGGREVKRGGKSMQIKLKAYAELDDAGNVVSESDNRTDVQNNQAQEDELPFSQREDGAVGDKIRGACLPGTITFETGTIIDTTCCVAKENGTITLGEDPNKEEFDVKKGYFKCSMKVVSHTWSDGATKLRLEYSISPPRGKGPKGENRGPKEDGTRPPKVVEFDGALMFLSTVAAVLTGDDPNTVLTWVTIADDDAEIQEINQKPVAFFVLPKPDDPTKKIWYDPMMNLEEDEDVNDDNDYNSASSMAATMLTTLTCILTALNLY